MKGRPHYLRGQTEEESRILLPTYRRGELGGICMGEEIFGPLLPIMEYQEWMKPGNDQ